MKKVYGFLVMAFLFLLASNAHATWLSTTGEITGITLYSHTDTIIVTLSDAGAVVPECTDTTSFAIDGSMSSDRRKQMLSMLLSAKAALKPVTVSYSNVGGCVPYGSNPNQFRGITRLSQ